MKKSLLTVRLIVGGLLLTASALPAIAQTAPENKVYTFVEKMPQLVGGGGSQAIILAIQQRIAYPAEALREHVEGRVFVSFTVTREGRVKQVTIVKALHPACDSAVVQAVRQLPMFEPGIQDGKPVAVNFTAPVTFQIPPPRPPKPGLIR